MLYDFLIVGGGASGISAYITYKRKNPNSKVLILESNKELLKKLSATGNGKCNFTNENISKSFYNSDSIFDNVINENSTSNMLKFFESLNIKYFKDEEGRYYPISLSAKSVQEIMVSKVKKEDLKLETKVDKIINNNGIFLVYDKLNNLYKAKNVLVSTGSKNYKNLGSDGSIFHTLMELGHNFTKLYPSNIYIKVKETNITKLLSGLRFKATLSLYNSNKFIYKEKGELLFKDDALSGIVSFNVSSKLALLYKKDLVNNPYITVDFLESYNTNYIDEIKDNKILKNELLGLFHPTLVELLLNNKNIDNLIHNMKFNVVSLGDFSNAQVTSGGIKSDEINSSLESKLYNNLYFSGDILDNDGICGGYNLTFAILSGIKVGEEVE